MSNKFGIWKIVAIIIDLVCVKLIFEIIRMMAAGPTILKCSLLVLFECIGQMLLTSLRLGRIYYITQQKEVKLKLVIIIREETPNTTVT